MVVKSDNNEFTLADLEPKQSGQSTQEEFTLADLEPKQQEATMEQLSQGIFGESKAGKLAENITVNTLISPLTEVARGLYKGSASFYGKADAVQQLIEKIPMVPDAPDIFANWAQNLTDVAESIPETQMNEPTKVIYDLLGGQYRW